MKKYRSIFISCLLILFTLVLAACTQKFTVKFIDVDGTVLKTEEVESGAAATAPELPTHEGLEFVKWDQEFDAVTSDLTVKAVYFGLSETKKLKMDFSFENKEFIKNGVGEVRVNRVVDGDTMSVWTSGSHESITIRFLGIDTPESTGSIEPWGKVSSKYAKETLYNAASVVLEAEGEDRMDSNGTRWLAWVWYKPTEDSEYRLFNLEEVELAYAKYSQNVNSKYHNQLKVANDNVKLTGRRVWGEIDLGFNYSKEVVETTLLDLWYNHETFQSGTKFYVTVRLVRTVGNNMYLEDAEEQTLELADGTIVNGKGSFYAFYGYSAPYYRYYKIGDVIRMRVQLEWDGDYGTQLTGVAETQLVDGMSAEPVIPVIDANQLGYSIRDVKDKEGNVIQAKTSDLANYVCQVVTVENLILRSTDDIRLSSDKSYYTVKMYNSKGDVFDVYFGNGLISKWKVEEVLQPGKKYAITGGIAYYMYANGYYQIAVGDAPRYSNGELHPEDTIRVNDIKEMK